MFYPYIQSLAEEGKGFVTTPPPPTLSLFIDSQGEGRGVRYIKHFFSNVPSKWIFQEEGGGGGKVPPPPSWNHITTRQCLWYWIQYMVVLCTILHYSIRTWWNNKRNSQILHFYTISYKAWQPQFTNPKEERKRFVKCLTSPKWGKTELK